MTSVNLEQEAAPLVNLSQKPPIELDRAVRIELMQDQSKINHQILQEKTTALQPLGALLLLIAAYFLLKKWFARQGIQERRPVEKKKATAKEKAQFILLKLQKQEILDPKLIDQFIREISSIVLGYFEENYRVQLSSDTTPELLKELQSHSDINVKQKEQLNGFMQDIDAVKFGHYRPTLRECEQLYATVQAITVPD